MLKKIAFIISCIFITSFVLADQSFDASYNFTTGSNDYRSNAVFCETIFNNTDNTRSLTCSLSLLSDVDYDLVGTITLKPKIVIGTGIKAGLIAGLSEGKQKNNSTVSSSSFGILIEKNIKDFTTATLEYVHSRGNIYSEIYRNVIEQTVIGNGNSNGKGKGRNNRIPVTSTTTVQISESVVSEYSSDTISAIFDTDLSFIMEKLSSYIQVSFSQSSEDINITSGGLSLIYHINTKTSLSGNFTTTSNNLDQSDNYYGLGLARSF